MSVIIEKEIAAKAKRLPHLSSAWIEYEDEDYDIYYDEDEDYDVTMMLHSWLLIDNPHLILIFRIQEWGSFFFCHNSSFEA